MKWSLRRRIEQFIRRTGISATRLGLDSTGDPKLVFEIRKGRTPRPRMEARVVAYMDRIDRAGGLSPARRRRR